MITKPHNQLIFTSCFIFLMILPMQLIPIYLFKYFSYFLLKLSDYNDITKKPTKRKIRTTYDLRPISKNKIAFDVYSMCQKKVGAAGGGELPPTVSMYVLFKVMSYTTDPSTYVVIVLPYISASQSSMKSKASSSVGGCIVRTFLRC